MHKRHGLLTAIMVVLLPSLIACGGTTEPAAAPTTGTGGGATTAPITAPTPGGTASELNFAALQVEEGATLTLVTPGDATEQKLVQDSIDRFKAQFPNVQVKLEVVPADYQLKIKADAAGNTLGDVFFIDSGLMNALAPNGILLELDSAMQQIGMKPADFAGPLLTLFQDGGKTYALPKDFGALAVHINNRLAQEAGVTIPVDGNWDWAAYRAAAEKMTKGDGATKVFGTCAPPEIDRAGALVFANGGSILSADGKTATYNQKPAVEAIEFWHKLYKDGLGAVPKEIGQDWCGAAFGNEKVAMILEGGWLFSFMTQTYPNIKYTTVPIPNAPTGKRGTLLFTNAWTVSAQSKFPKAAAALAMFMVSPGNQKFITETGFALPSVTAQLNNPFFETHPNEAVIAKSVEYGTLAVYGPKNDDFREPLKQALESIWLGQQDVQPALDDAAQKSNEVLK